MPLPRAVLIVEDDVDDAFLFQSCLERVGKFNLTVVRDGKAAKDFLEGGKASGYPPPEIIFLDLHMPILGGHQFLEWKRLQPAFAAIPCFVVSGKMDPVTPLENAARGALRSISKPVTATALAIALASL